MNKVIWSDYDIALHETALDLLGDAFDLHGGGNDLAFPHHENERAQAVAGGHQFARQWVHSGMVTSGGQEMHKSLGNSVSLTELLERVDPRAYRLLVLRAHYRSPMEATEDTLADAEAVCGIDPLDEPDVVDLLAALVDRSMVVAEPGARGPAGARRALSGRVEVVE